MYRQGDRAACIADVRRRLGVMPVVPLFDALLAQRIRGIQMVSGIPVTGVLDAETAQAAGVSDLMGERVWA